MAGDGGPRRSTRTPGALLLLVVIAVVLGVVLRMDTLQAGFRTDDHVQLALLEGRFPIARAPWDLFWFGGRSAAEHEALRNAGYLPWWADSEHRVAMLRPLSSALLWLDHRVLGHGALGYHAHSLMWLAALLLAVAAFLRQVLPGPIAATALVLYALDEAHSVPAGWIANRSALLATTFGVLALGAHLRHRKLHAGGGALAALWLALSLAAGEYGLCMVGYLIAWELLVRRGSMMQRARALGPALGLCGVYVAAHAALGYGPRASGYYLSPFSDPIEFFVRGGARIGALCGELSLGLEASHLHSGPPLRSALIGLGWFDPQSWQRLPNWGPVHVALGLLGACVLVGIARRLSRAPGDHSPAAAWLLAGALGSLPVVAGSLPESRLLLAAGIGTAALWASVLHAALAALRVDAGARVRALALLAALFVGLSHGVLPGLRSHASANAMAARAHAERRQADSADLNGEGSAWLVSASDFATAAHLPFIRALDGRGGPAVHRMSGGRVAHDLTRIDDRTIELTLLASDLTDSFAGSLYRPRSAGFSPGDQFALAGARITVLATRGGNPARLRLQYATSLADVRLLQASTSGVAALSAPAIGETVRLRRASTAWAATR